MYIYTFLICLAGICFGVILMVMGNILKNSGHLFGVFSVDKTTKEYQNFKEKIIPLLKILGNFMFILGILLSTALIYFILFTLNLRT